MENCLVTKLKGVVNNDSLPILDTLLLEAAYKASPLQNEKQLSIIPVDGTTVTVTSEDYTYIVDATNHTPQIELTHDDRKVYIKSVYNIKEITLTGINNGVFHPVSGLDSLLNAGNTRKITFSGNAGTVINADNATINLPNCTSGKLEYITAGNGVGLFGNWDAIVGNNPNLHTANLWGNDVNRKITESFKTSGLEFARGFNGNIEYLPAVIKKIGNATANDYTSGSINNLIAYIKQNDPLRATAGAIMLDIKGSGNLCTVDGVAVMQWALSKGLSNVNTFYIEWNGNVISASQTAPASYIPPTEE